MTSDCESELNGGGEEGEGGEAHAQQENIRQISQNITNKFGTHRYQRSTIFITTISVSDPDSSSPDPDPAL
jgi:hypothetical protein